MHSRRRKILMTGWALLTAFCPAVAAIVAADEPATLIVTGRIWTGNPAAPWAEAAAIRGDRFIAVGPRADLEKLRGDGTKTLDAGDGLVVPGLIDSHVHLIDGGMHLSSVELRDAATREEFVKRIGEFAAKTPPGEWITGGDWDHTLWGGALPERSWVDAVTDDHPMWIQRLDGHMGLANSAALAAAGVKDDVADVDGGEIVRDATGKPTGVLKDNAMGLVDHAVPNPSQERRLDAIRAAAEYFAAHGVTAVHHMGTWQDLDDFREAQKRGLLTMRIYACTPLAAWQRLADEVAKHGRGDQWVRIGGLKGFVDGSLGSHTAAMLEPFTDAPKDRGLLVNTLEDLETWTAAADAAGLQVMVHAIGDRAIRLQLDIFDRVAAKNGQRDRRFRIEHSQHIAPADLSRFAKLGVVASMQPYHCIDDGRWAEAVIGPQRSETTYAFRSLLDSHAHVAFGSDWFVAPADPMWGIYSAVTRRTLDGKHPEGWIPGQKISVEESLRCYTSDAAYAAFEEKSLGTIEAGKLADFVILDRDLFATPPEKLNEVAVRATVVGGVVRYEADPR